ncbi:hypothetical protein [Bordetella phage vB_BbrM_PHB04]|uniref:Uncharacterized protein n=1 Tax=Bordetella phage vB_BbrM_PHB04 TaxID=2029657 RepID=A0A291LAQ1_9CAUD|nr:hypothetical protein HOS14_gp079 [Bordetella phage vB_BbrM_PHB04]ATI15697.1 hypothetical protein [Bordetella phage vB_BbrM_PHB04]
MKIYTSPGSGDYFDGSDNYGPLGFRLLGDRRFWMAWANVGAAGENRVSRAVMDDFGTLVETARLETA